MNGSDELEANENLKMGQIYNNVTGDAFDGKEGIIVVPCAYQRQYAEWLPTRGKGNPPQATYDANSDILTKTTRNKEDNKENLKVEYIDFDYAIINPKNLVGVEEFNQTFFDKIDQIEIDIAELVNGEILDSLNEITNEMGLECNNKSEI